MSQIELDYRSGALGYHEEVMVTLPDGDFTKPYPVLWLMHGANQDCTEWVRNTSIERYANKRGLAVVMPTYSNGMGCDMVHGFDYYTMLSEELPEAVWAMLPCLSKDPAENFVAGASMGGYTALKLALNKPERYAACGIFGGVVDVVSVLSGTADDGMEQVPPALTLAFGTPEDVKETNGDLIWLGEKLAKEGRFPRLWSVCGHQDFCRPQLIRGLDRLKAAGADITELWDNGVHSFDLWDRYLEAFLDWLPLKGGK